MSHRSSAVDISLSSASMPHHLRDKFTRSSSSSEALGPASVSHFVETITPALEQRQAVSQRLGVSTETVRKLASSIAPCSRSHGQTSSKTSVIDQLRIAPWLSNTASASAGNQSIVAQ